MRWLCVAVVACTMQAAVFPVGGVRVLENEVTMLEGESPQVSPLDADNLGDLGSSIEEGESSRKGKGKGQGAMFKAQDAAADQDETAANSSPVGKEEDPNGAPPGSDGPTAPDNTNNPGDQTASVQLSPEEEKAKQECGSSNGCDSPTAEEEPGVAPGSKGANEVKSVNANDDGNSLPESGKEWKKSDGDTDAQGLPRPNQDDTSTQDSNGDAKKLSGGAEATEGQEHGTAVAYDPGSGGANPTPIQKSINAVIANSNGAMSNYRDPILEMADLKKKEQLRKDDADTEAETAALFDAATPPVDASPGDSKEGDEVSRKTGGWYSEEGTQMWIPQGDPQVAAKVKQLHDERDAVDLMKNGYKKDEKKAAIEKELHDIMMKQPKQAEVRDYRSVWHGKQAEKREQEAKENPNLPQKQDKKPKPIYSEQKRLEMRKERVLSYPDGPSKMRQLKAIRIAERLLIERGDKEAAKPVDTDPKPLSIACIRQKKKADAAATAGTPAPNVELGEEGCY